MNCLSFGRPFELSRHNGQLSEDDQALNDDQAPSSSDLLRLMEQTYYEILPSPRISPESWQILPEVVVTSDSEASSGKIL